jgi:hypothetical protein
LCELKVVLIHKNVYLTGKEGSYQVIMKMVELDLVPEPICETELRKTRLGVHFTLDRSFLCAGGEPNKDTCKGKLKCLR